MTIYYVVWGLRPGETRTYMEDIAGEGIVTLGEAKRVAKLAELNGWTHVRVSRVDLRQPPDFIGTINI